MRFWFDAGVSGFHIEGLEYLVENRDVKAVDDENRSQTRNYVGTLEVLEKLREVANSFSDKPGRERLALSTNLCGIFSKYTNPEISVVFFFN